MQLVSKVNIKNKALDYTERNPLDTLRFYPQGGTTDNKEPPKCVH